MWRSMRMRSYFLPFLRRLRAGKGGREKGGGECTMVFVDVIFDGN